MADLTSPPKVEGIANSSQSLPEEALGRVRSKPAPRKPAAQPDPQLGVPDEDEKPKLDEMA